MNKQFFKLPLLLIILLLNFFSASTQSKIDSLFPVRGFSISAPSPSFLDSFILFINQELAPRKVNTLLLRVDYKYQYKTHPELRGSETLSEADIKKIVAACRKNGIQIVPQINLLGHQSWASQIGKLLEVYPEFDETPHIKLPEVYKWPNADGLYCKSYCPLHPGVHKVVFDLVDEICDVFETNAFHAGMDEVFYIGDDKCPRCSGRDKAELFADEVRTIRNHLAEKNRTLWIWGDRLIDGKTTGLGIWEASFNNTHRAIDLIPKDVVICDWHYERADKTAVLFAMKGFKVITCPWRRPEVTVQQVNDMYAFRQTATSATKDRYYGIMQTIWTGAGNFFQNLYPKQPVTPANNNTQENSFKTLFDQMNKLAK